MTTTILIGTDPDAAGGAGAAATGGAETVEAPMGRRFQKTVSRTLQHNIYEGLAHDIYSQMLRQYMNWTALPQIVINIVSAALGTVVLASLTNSEFLGVLISQILLNVIAAVLVGLQKNFGFAEKAAIHKAIKEEFFKAADVEATLVRDLVEDERGDWYNLEGQPLVGALLSSRTKTLQDVEQRLHGAPKDPVPESVVNRLQPYVARMQKEGFKDRNELKMFPTVLGLKSYLLDAPDPLGCISVVCDAQPCCQVGPSCFMPSLQLEDHPCALLCCGIPAFFVMQPKSSAKTAAPSSTDPQASRRSGADGASNAAPPSIAPPGSSAAAPSPTPPAISAAAPSTTPPGSSAAAPSTASPGSSAAPPSTAPGSNAATPSTAPPGSSAAPPSTDPPCSSAAPPSTASPGGSAAPPSTAPGSNAATPSTASPGSSAAPPSTDPPGSNAATPSTASPGSSAAAASTTPPAISAATPSTDPPASSAAAPSATPPAISAAAPSTMPPASSAAAPSSMPPAISAAAPSTDPPASSAAAAPIATALPASTATTGPVAPTLSRPPGSPEPQPVAEGVEVSGLGASQRELCEVGQLGSFAIVTVDITNEWQQPARFRPRLYNSRPIAEADEDDGQDAIAGGGQGSSREVRSAVQAPAPASQVNLVLDGSGNVRDGPAVGAPQAPGVQDNVVGVDISKAFMKHLRSTLSRYLFTAMLHELYSQRLKQHLNLIIIPLIFLNAFSAVLSSGSLASIQNLSDGLRQGLSVATTVINIVAAVLVAVQKFFSLAEKGALHDAIKQAYFSAASDVGCLTAEVKRLPNKKTLVDANGRDLPAKQVSEALQKLADLEKKLEGAPNEPVPEGVARQLQPYVLSQLDKSERQEQDKYLRDFPPMLGLRSSFLSVPARNGLCTVACDGNVKWQCGACCGPVQHKFVENGCELLCCGGRCMACAKAPRTSQQQQETNARNVQGAVDSPPQLGQMDRNTQGVQRTCGCCSRWLK